MPHIVALRSSARRIVPTVVCPCSVMVARLHTSPTSPKAQSEADAALPLGPFGRMLGGLNSLKSTLLKIPPIAAVGVGGSAPIPFTGRANSWSQAVREAQSLVVEYDQDQKIIDPIKLVGRDLRDMRDNIATLLGSGHPLLNTVSKYYFSAEGKNIRPLLVLLAAQATSIAPKQYLVSFSDEYEIIDTPISPMLQNTTTRTAHHDALYTPSVTKQGCMILPTQRRLAEIVEMIHTASLLHDDVIDASEARRGLPSANVNFGNKMAILAGDFMLARASVSLARLRNAEVIELLATTIANLVEGEFMQLKNTQKGKNGEAPRMTTFEYYMEKSYMKTASLIAKSCRASAVLGGNTKEVTELAYTYGRNLGLAFQLVDDMLDFTLSSTQFGKPTGADLTLGLATAPVLYAWEEFPELGPLIERKFSQPGDVEKVARALVYQSNGLKQTRALAESHCQAAIDAAMQFPPSDARSALIQLTEKMVTRQK
ncbi:solanesyl pyrophosphate synthase [Jimgerdemannia flammicorona]|uniref:Solanesyl pyrophosphate synthase n=2 Tax=Jimgerdemannia flammicorona TaxID=994334 RepID=A0A433PHD9_9FUNG|nr:solanesyl pyrophosphate synthase [Jimgerdemannia flammicorona]RUS16957.1 solanesyl pyrophosphate synthase [Jimgerdemannia flammicorona]